MTVRDWRRINDGLVRRRDILLDLCVFDCWDSELGRINAGKEGDRYVYPNIFASLLGYAHVFFRLPYRLTKEDYGNDIVFAVE